MNVGERFKALAQGFPLSSFGHRLGVPPGSLENRIQHRAGLLDARVDGERFHKGKTALCRLSQMRHALRQPRQRLPCPGHSLLDVCPCLTE